LIFAAAGTGALDGLTSKPLDLIKIRQQMFPAVPSPISGHLHRTGAGPIGTSAVTCIAHAKFSDSVRVLMKEEGLPVLFRGLLPSVLREALGNAAFFAAYHGTKNLLQDRQDDLDRTLATETNNSKRPRSSGPRPLIIKDDTSKNKNHRLLQVKAKLSEKIGRLNRNVYTGGNSAIMIAGAVAGLAYALTSHPFDIAAILMQSDLPRRVSQSANPSVSVLASGSTRGLRYQYRDIFQCLRQTVNQEGLGALYKGITPSVIRALPAYAASFWGYEATLAIVEQFRSKAIASAAIEKRKLSARKDEKLRRSRAN
jgi:Mitochondrial carrier protein